MCTEYIIPLFTLSRMAPAREVPAPPPARGVRTCLAHDFTSERPYMFRPRHRMPSPHPLPQCAQPPLRTRLPFRMRPPFHAPSPLRARRRRPGAAPRTCSSTPPRSAAPPQDEISLRNNLFRRLYRILLETRRAAWRGGFGNRGPPRGVMRSDAMNCGPPRVCLGSLSKSIKQRGIPCPDVLTNPVSHEKIGISVLFFQMSTRRTARGTHRRPAPRAARVLRASTRRVPTRRCPRTKAPPPFFFSLTPTCRRSSPAGASG